jgi:Transposase IS4
MKSKPISSGFKIWAFCDRGYVYEFFPHSNRFPWKYTTKYKEGSDKLMSSSTVVATLVDSLPGGQDGSVQYEVYMDNLFSSVALFDMLRRRGKGIGCAGTTRSNTKKFPSELKVRGGADKRMQWDSLGAVVVDNVLCLCWIDNGAVLMLTTIHQAGPEHTIMRRRKRPRLTSTNGVKVQKVFGKDVTKVLAIPKVVDDYNMFMNGVDIADQLISNYKTHLKGARTWMPLLFWLIDVSITNSYLSMRAKFPGIWAAKRNGHAQFRMDVAISLMKSRAPPSAAEPSCSGSIDLHNSSGGAGASSEALVSVSKKRRRRSSDLANDDSRMSWDIKHLPKCAPNGERQLCIVCSLRGAKRRSRVFCTACSQGNLNVFLCCGADNRNCYYEYHTKLASELNTP